MCVTLCVLRYYFLSIIRASKFYFYSICFLLFRVNCVGQKNIASFFTQNYPRGEKPEYLVTMSKNYAEKFKMYTLGANSEAKPTYETILQRLNAISCAHVTLREPINKNKNNNLMENNSNKANNRWCTSENAVCDTPTQELQISVQQQQQQRDYRIQQQRLLQQSPLPLINSTIETLVHTTHYVLIHIFPFANTHWHSLVSCYSG